MAIATQAEARANRELYEQDFAQWADETARLIREGRMEEISLEELAEEVESLGRSQRQEAGNRYATLVAHILKWRYQPEKRKGGWQATIVRTQKMLLRLFRDSPSVRRAVREEWPRLWDDGRAIALAETRLPGLSIPDAPDLTPEECLTIELAWED
jgi:hypothetical protein